MTDIGQPGTPDGPPVELGSSDAPPAIVYAGTERSVKARRVPIRCRLGLHHYRPRATAGVEQCTGCGHQRPLIWGTP